MFHLFIQAPARVCVKDSHKSANRAENLKSDSAWDKALIKLAGLRETQTLSVESIQVHIHVRMYTRRQAHRVHKLNTKYTEECIFTADTYTCVHAYTHKHSSNDLMFLDTSSTDSANI